MRTPTGFKITARGRAAHPGERMSCTAREPQRGSILQECATCDGIFRKPAGGLVFGDDFPLFVQFAQLDESKCTWNGELQQDVILLDLEPQ
jgi:hypothetical protein